MKSRAWLLGLLFASLPTLAWAEKAKPHLIMRIDLNSAEKTYFSVKPEDLVDADAQCWLQGQRLEKVVAASHRVSQDEIRNWSNAHEAELAKGQPASILLAGGSSVPFKDLHQIAAEVRRVAPEGKLAKELRWLVEHEADLVTGQPQTWGWGWGWGYGGYWGGYAYAPYYYGFSPNYFYGYYYPSYAYAAPYAYYSPYHYYGYGWRGCG